MSSLKELAHLKIPLDEVKLATNNFDEENVIGRGGFSKVYKAQLLQSGHWIDIAVKRSNSKFGIGYREFLSEITMLSRLRHDNLVSFIGFCDVGDEKIVVLKHEIHGSLDKYLSSPNLTWIQRLKICVGAARGLNHLHYDVGRNYSVMHRNIKSSKILLDDNWEAKICGFGLSIVNPECRKHRLLLSPAYGTIDYVDPVNVKTGSVTDKSDVYSFGVVLFEVLYGRLAIDSRFQGQHRSLAHLVQHYKGKLDEIIHPDLKKQMDPESLRIFKETAYHCLSEQRPQRPNMDQVVKRLETALEFQQKLEEPEYPTFEGTPSNYNKTMSYVKNLEHLKIPLVDIKLATRDFDKNKLIGDGGYGMVYKAELNHFDDKNSSGVSGQHKRSSTVAIKRLIGERGQGEREFLTEIEMLHSCKHPNIVSLLGFCDEGPEMILVYEYAHKRSLDKYLGSKDGMGSLTWAQRLQICLDTARGLDHLHSGIGDKYRIIHRDIKSANILLGQNWEAKIADFGLSRIGPANQQATYLMTNVAGTNVYCDPQYENTGILTKESDVFSFGVVLFEVMCGRLAYDETYKIDDEQRLLPKYARRCFEQGRLHEIIDPNLKGETDESYFTLDNGVNEQSLDTFSEIANQCLQEKKDKRPTMQTVIIQLEKALNFQVNRVDILKISFNDIKLATDNFSVTNLIARGGSGNVYRGELSHTGGRSTVAVRRHAAKFGVGETEFLAELEILFDYKHENVVRLLGYCNELDEKIIVYEHAVHDSLDRHLNNTSLTWMKRLKICTGVARGLAFLHGSVGTQLRVIHGDIKSSNILLNHDWEAKITNFGLSIIRPRNLQMDFLTENIAGTFGYVDPQYYQRRILTKESDVYSFGVVLFEILCGRPAIMGRYGDENHLLGLFATYYFKQGKLDEIIFHDIKKQIAPNSLNTFSSIAYQCLQYEREERPTIHRVLEKLEKALEFQEDYEIWEPKLPRDYEEIINMSETPVLCSTKTKKELYSLLSSGILLQKGKVWFSLSVDGFINEMISATMFSYKNRKSHKWRSTQKSRFHTVAEMSDISSLNIHIQIKTQFLTLGIIYGAYLVFKFCEPRKVSSGLTYVNLRYKLGEETLNTYFAQLREDGWMMIELRRFLNHDKATNPKVVLNGFSHYYCRSGAIYVQGIEFRATDKASQKIPPFVEHEENEKLKDLDVPLKSELDIDRVQHLPNDYEEIVKRSKNYVRNSNKEELCFLLSKGILIDEGEKLFWLSKVNGKKCHMLPAKAFLYDSPNVKCFNWKPPSQSRFEEVVEFLSQQVFRIKCKIEIHMLSPDMEYACYFVFKLTEKCRGLVCPIKVRDLHCRKNEGTKILYFRSPSLMNLHDIQWVPKQREDGWMEVVVWEFSFNSERHSEFLPMNLKLISYEGTMYGLIVCGIEFRPI